MAGVPVFVRQESDDDMNAKLFLAILITLASAAARSDTAARSDPAPTGLSFHGGVGVSLLIVPSLQLQIEGRQWFVAAEFAGGFGGWGFSEFAVGKAGYVFDGRLHPYIAAGVGHGGASNLDELNGGGLTFVAEAGLLVGKERTWGRIMPFVELPIATWSTPDPKGTKPWTPGVGYPLVGLRFML
jgi:hypothetical protein